MLQHLLDNPIFVKHLRSRLRRAQVLPVAVAMPILCGAILWGGGLLGGLGNGATFTALVLLQAVVLLLGGTAQVGAAVGQASESGMLEFHRASPLPARVQAFGFVLGAPIREYAIAAMICPFALVCALCGAPGAIGYATILGAMLVSAVTFHTLGALGGLVVRSRRGSAGGLAIAILLLCAASGTSRGLLLPVMLTPLPAFYAAMQDTAIGRAMAAPTLFGLQVPLTLQGLIFQLPVLFFLFVAVVRRLRAADAHVYGRRTAVACLLTVVVLTFGAVAGHADLAVESRPALVRYVAFFVAVALVVAITASSRELARGVRRAARLRIGKLSAWHDLAPNGHVVAVLAMLCAAVSGLADVALRGRWLETTALAIAYAGVAVFAFGTMLQHLAAVLARRWASYFFLLLFAVWIVPLMAAALAALAGWSEAGHFIASLSPIVGVGAPTTLGLALHGALAYGFGMAARRRPATPAATPA